MTGVAVQRFRKKPVVVEVTQWDGTWADADRITEWIDDNGGDAVYERPTPFEREAPALLISTLEGVMRADPHDWIVRGVKGEFYAVKPDIFEATYERA